MRSSVSRVFFFATCQFIKIFKYSIIKTKASVQGVMDIFRWRKIVMILLCFVYGASGAQAGAWEDYKAAKLQYMAAMVSMASYNDRAGVIARESLANEGWFMRPYNRSFNGTDAKFFTVQSDAFEPGLEIYIVSVTGTESAGDIKTDLNFSKAFFGGAAPTEFADEAMRKDLTSSDPMVHRGFNRYTQTAFFSQEEVSGETFGEYLAELLREKKNRRLYLTGHSLGGAVATLGAARLVSMGVSTEQLRVVTFGAPAIGNTAFAQAYGVALPLDRIVIKDDPVRGLLQSISGGYAQFGRQTDWQERVHVYRKSHSIGVYVDAAIRNYYDAAEGLKRAGLDNPDDPERVDGGAAKVYIAPVAVRLPKGLRGDISYMHELMEDAIQKSLSDYIVDEGESASLAEELEKARQEGCRWLLRASINMEKVREERGVFFVEYHEELFDVQSGALKNAAAYANDTKHFTPLQAAQLNVYRAKEERQLALGVS